MLVTLSGCIIFTEKGQPKAAMPMARSLTSTQRINGLPDVARPQVQA